MSRSTFMNMMTQQINMKRLLLLIAIVLLGLYAVHGVPQEQQDGLREARIVRPGGRVPAEEDWTLSLYRGGETILRVQRTSLEMCLSAGGSYMADKTADGFNCGLNCDFNCDFNCENWTDLSRFIRCERVCDTSRCRPANEGNTRSLDD